MSKLSQELLSELGENFETSREYIARLSHHMTAIEALLESYRDFASTAQTPNVHDLIQKTRLLERTRLVLGEAEEPQSTEDPTISAMTKSFREAAKQHQAELQE